MRGSVLGLGVIAPDAPNAQALLASLAAPTAFAGRRVLAFPEEEPKVRRLPRLDRMVVAAAREALGGKVPEEPLGLVVGTGYGGLSATAEFLDGIATRGPAFGSPTRFHESVHHSPGGQVSLLLGLRGPSLTASARELSGETALEVGLSLLSTGLVRRVLVIAADERTPALDSAYQAFGVLGGESPQALHPGEGAAAVLLGPEPGAMEVESHRVLSHPTPVLRFAGAEVFGPPLAGAARALSGAVAFSPAAPNRLIQGQELAARGDSAGDVWSDAQRFGFHASAGLLRFAAAALRLTSMPVESRCLLHGLSLGGGHALTVLRRGHG